MTDVAIEEYSVSLLLESLELLCSMFRVIIHVRISSVAFD